MQKVSDDDFSLGFGDIMTAEPSSSHLVNIQFGSRSQSEEEFSSEDETSEDSSESGSESESDNSDLEASDQTLFIQMEYCENQTLKDLIDRGIAQVESWRIFRQLLEGLDHIHAQGIVHRDLKPANVFLDLAGNVKIGDFGLATTNQTVAEAIMSRNASFDPTHTQTTGVGTFLYVAPEVLNARSLGRTYDHKVDLYSLGIMLFEMVFPFSTGMERIMTLTELRKPSIVFPAKFDYENLKNQAKITKRLLDHDPNKRPSAAELLKSELLPPRLEDEIVQECLRILSNPETPHYGQILKALLSQTDAHTDFTFDFDPSARVDVRASESALLQFVALSLETVFRRHGAVHMDAPFLVPKSDVADEADAHELIDSNGSVVQLPFDLTLPFVRYAAQNAIASIKRFSFGRVYRRPPISGQPRMVYECAFDVLAAVDILPEVEVMKATEEALMSFAPIERQSLCFRVNHCSCIDTILDHLGTPPDRRNLAINAIKRLPFSDSISAEALHGNDGFTQAFLREIEKFHIEASIYSRLQSIISDPVLKVRLKRSVDVLLKIEEAFRTLGGTSQIMFAPLAIYKPHYYKNGALFLASISGRGAGDALAAGGRYDALLKRYTSVIPSLRSVKVGGAGVNIAANKLIQLLLDEASRSSSEDAHDLSTVCKRCDVLIGSIGPNLASERLGLAAELWSLGISADVSLKEDQSVDDLLAECKRHYIPWLFLVRHRAHRVKVKGVLRKMEEDVPRSDLTSWLERHILQPGSTQEKALEKSSLDATFNVNIDLVKPAHKQKMKHRQKQNIYDKAISAVTSQIHGMKGQQDVLVVDINKLTCSLFVMDAYTRIKDIENLVPSSQRDYIRGIMDQFSELKAAGKSYVWLYSHRDGEAVLCKL